MGNFEVYRQTENILGRCLAVQTGCIFLALKTKC